MSSSGSTDKPKFGGEKLPAEQVKSNADNHSDQKNPNNPKFQAPKTPAKPAQH